MRFIGMDVHQDFCEIAIAEEGRVRSAGRVKTTRRELELFAQSLAPDDHVALEATANALAIARLLDGHVGRVVVANTKKLRQISEAKAKTDRLDARTLARVLASGFLDVVWMPDEATRALRRWIARRAQLVRQRTRAKNEIHAVLVRTLTVGPGVSDLFGKAGRAWLTEVELPVDERVAIEGCLRQIAFLDAEILIVERAIAEQALGSAEIRRLLTVPGVDMITAATFMGFVGDISRFSSPRQLVGYFGLDPKVRQSGSGPARYGRISKEGATEARHVLCEAAKAAARTPGPLRAFAHRVRDRRGSNIATVAVARKLCVLFWHLLIRGEDYAYGRPSLTAKSSAASSCCSALRRDAGAPRACPPATAARRCATKNASSRPTPNRPTTDSSPTGRPAARRKRRVRAPPTGRAHQGPLRGKLRGRPQPQNLRFSTGSTRTQPSASHSPTPAVQT